MRQFSSLLFATAMAFTLLTFTQCKKDTSQPSAPQEADYSINPSDANALSKVIQFGNAEILQGVIPSGTSRNTQDFDYNPSLSVSTGGSTTYIPLMFDGTEAIDKILLMVKGATNQYFSVKSGTNDLTGIINISMTIPKSVNSGNFSLIIVLLGADGGIISMNEMNVPIKVKKPYDCSTSSISISGSDGITQTMHDLGGKAGNVIIDWETYSVPDRVDVYLDGQWIAGTGSTIAPPPPMCKCNNPLPGFVGDNGTFTIPVTASNKKIEVYVSGCIGGGTAWDYTYKCAQ